MDVVEKLKEILVPHLTHLFLNKASYFDDEFVKSCIDELETLSYLDSQLSPLQMLALTVLLDSAYIDIKAIDSSLVE